MTTSIAYSPFFTRATQRSPFSLFDEVFGDTRASSTGISSHSSAVGPAYNLVKVNETELELSLPVAGFNQADINITLDANVLKIVGEKTAEIEEDKDSAETPTKEVIHRGFTLRNFERSFTLDDHIEIKSARLTDGLLEIQLVRNIPEASKPKQIEIQ